MVVIMKSSIFWNVTACRPLKVNWHSGGTCHLHLQGQRMSQASNVLHAGFFLGPFFEPEDGGDMFHQNIS
jgi:hypothetical protein